MVPNITDEEKQVTDINKESLMTLLKQIKFDLSGENLLLNYFEVLEILINLFYSMEFNLNIQKLKEVKNKFAKDKLIEKELIIYNLETDLTEKLSKLVEISEQKDLNQVKKLIISYQRDIRKKITIEIRKFRFKLIQVLFLLKTFGLN